MPLKPDVLLNLPFEDVVQTYTAEDCMRYALSIGVGHDPLDPAQLRYVYEKGLQSFPTMAAVLACAPPWSTRPETGVTRGKLVHGEQRLQVHAPLPVAGAVRSRERITAVYDKGADRGAIVATERQLRDNADGRLLATLQSLVYCRADGGFGGDSGPPASERASPTGTSRTIDMPTVPQQALLYRLNFDRNPLHADPVVAQAAGFPRPILHGLATWGIAAHGLVQSVLQGDSSRLRHFEVRFSQPVFPGETLTLEHWVQGAEVHFRGFVRARDAKVLDRGYALVQT